MNIAFWTSIDKGGSPLVIGLERGLKTLGHHVEPHRPSGTYDLTLMFNQSAHTTDYAYPEMPKDPVVFIDSAEYGYFRRLPGVVHNYWNTFTPAAIGHDTKNAQQQGRLLEFLRGKSFPYFIREFSKHIAFPANYHPIDYPLYHYSVCHQAPRREQYLSRELDLFVSWGASHPWRMHITEALRACHTKCEIFVLEQDGAIRIPHDRYFARTSAAKVGVSFDGYGSGSFRMTEVLVRGLLLQGPLSIRLPVELVDGVHCIEYQLETSGEAFLSTNVCQKLREALSDPERSFRIYEAGYHLVMQQYTERAMADYVLRTAFKHDWKVVTELESLPPKTSVTS